MILKKKYSNSSTSSQESFNKDLVVIKQSISPKISTHLKNIEKELLKELTSNKPIEHALLIGEPEISEILCKMHHYCSHFLCEYYPEISSQQLHACVGDVTDLPYAKESMDLIILAHVLTPSDKARMIIEESVECLTGQGTLIIFLSQSTSFAIQRSLKKAGCDIVKAQAFFSILRYAAENQWTQLFDKTLAPYLPFLCHASYIVAQKKTSQASLIPRHSSKRFRMSFQLESQCATRLGNS